MPAIVASSSGDTTLVPALPGKRIRILNYFISASADVNVKWKSGASNDISGLIYAGSKGGAVLPHTEFGWLETNAGEPLVLNLASAVAVGGHFKWAYVD